MDGQDGHPTHGCMNPLRARFARRVPLLLRKRGRETVWVVLAPPHLAGHTPAFASLRVPFRGAKGDGRGGGSSSLGTTAEKVVIDFKAV